MVWGWDFFYSPSSFLSVIHNTWNRPRPASTACVLPYDKKSKSTFKDVAQVRKGNERILWVVQS